jgi:hypothetical protein
MMRSWPLWLLLMLHVHCVCLVSCKRPVIRWSSIVYGLYIGKDVGEQLWFHSRIQTPLESLMATNHMKAVSLKVRN